MKITGLFVITITIAAFGLTSSAIGQPGTKAKAAKPKHFAPNPSQGGLQTQILTRKQTRFQSTQIAVHETWRY